MKEQAAIESAARDAAWEKAVENAQPKGPFAYPSRYAFELGWNARGQQLEAQKEKVIAVAKDVLYCLDGMREASNQSNYGEASEWSWRTRQHTNKLLDLLQDPKLDELYRTDDDGVTAPEVCESKVLGIGHYDKRHFWKWDD